MICEKCDYAMTAFDADCPRCKGKGLAGVPVPTSKVPSNVATHQNAKKRASEPSIDGAVPQANVAPPKTMPAQPVASFTPCSGCPHCGNDQFESVPAIVNGGSWQEQSSWIEHSQIDTRSTSVGFGVVFGDKHSSPIATVNGGHTTGQAVSYGSGSSSGASSLAAMLAPPTQPEPPRPKGKQCLQGDRFWRSLIAMVAIYTLFARAMNIWFLILCEAAAFLFLLSSLPFKGTVDIGEQRAFEAAQAKFPEQWIIWNQLAYCKKCDVVFDPQTSKSSRPQSISTLL